jgi:hypothetical protein
LSLAGQRTRLTWGLSFGDTASIIVPEHTRKLTERLTHARDVAAAPKGRPQRRRLHNVLAIAIPLALLATGLVRYSGKNSGEPVAGDSLEPAAGAVQVATMPLSPVREAPVHEAALAAPALVAPVVEDLGDLAKALAPGEPELAPAPEATAPVAAPRAEEAPAKPRPEAAASTRARAPAARPTTSSTKAGATDPQGRASKPRPWWLPEPEKAPRKRPAANGIGANSAPIFD